VTKYENALITLDEFLVSNSIKYAVIGGIAVILYGYQRTTNDIDVTILCELEDLDRIHKLFESEFKPAFNGTLEYFKRNFILPVDEPGTNLRIDIAAGLTEFDRAVISRSKRICFGDAEISVCSIEDLIVYKLFAARFADLADIEILLKKNKNKIDSDYLIKTVGKFKELDREDMFQNLNKLLP
jgi:predicted nucleotidyltransferase